MRRNKNAPQGRKRLSHPLQIRINEKIMADARALAEAHGFSLSDAIREAIRVGLPIIARRLNPDDQLNETAPKYRATGAETLRESGSS